MMAPSSENPYLPPRTSGLAGRTASAADPRSPREWLLLEGGLAQGAVLVFTLLGLFALIGLGEAMLRLVAVLLLGHADRASTLTAALVALVIAELGAQCVALILFLRRRPRTAPVSTLGPVLWILVCLLGPPLNAGLGSLATMLLSRSLPVEALRGHLLIVNLISSVALLGRGILLGLGLLLAFQRWRRVDRRLEDLGGDP